jgi:cytochrome c556
MKAGCRKGAGAAAVAVVLGLAGSAEAASRKEESVDFRVGIFTGMRWHLGPMKAMVKGERPYDAEAFARRARRLDQLAAMPWEGFLEDTHNVRLSEALEAIWENRADFRDKARQLQRATEALVEATPASDVGAVRDELLAVAKACKACHDEYKE